MFIEKFKIDIDKIKKRNKELIAKNWIDKLSISQKKFLNFRKGPPRHLMNKDGLFGYYDLSDYLINPDKFSEIDINNIQAYMTTFEINQKFDHIPINNFKNDIKNILKQIQNKRIHNIQKYIEIEDSIFKKGIYVNDTIYRVQNTIFKDNIIKNSTSWSLTPQELFCSDEECHMYVTSIPKNIKVIYIENNSKDKNLEIFQNFNFYEFEFILPRNLEYKEIKTKTINIPNRNFDNKDEQFNKYKTIKFIIHYIKIIKILKNIDYPNIFQVKLSSSLY
jgi:hypothetical protein